MHRSLFRGKKKKKKKLNNKVGKSTAHLKACIQGTKAPTGNKHFNDGLGLLMHLYINVFPLEKRDQWQTQKRGSWGLLKPDLCPYYFIFMGNFKKSWIK